MILYAFLLFIAIGAAVALVNWRYGVYWFVAVGLLQDPVRKLVPGVPGYLVLATMPVWGAIVVAMFSSRKGNSVGREYPELGAVVTLFVVSLIPSALVSLTYGPGSWQLTLLGTLTYGSILLSVSIGHQLARDVRDVRRFLSFYCLAAGALLGGTLIEYFGISFPATGTEMLGFDWVRYAPGFIVHMVAGFFRSPDIMGWHAATVAMLSMTLALSGRAKGRWVWVLPAIWGTAITILCGRRKMMYMLPFFVIAVTVLAWRFGRRVRAVALLTSIAVTLGGVVFVYQQVQVDDSFLRYYTYNPADVYTQVEAHGYESLIDTFEESGFFGGGLGSASTGAHHLQLDRPAAWQESGPSRLLMDLGVPGFVGVVLLLFATGRCIRSVFKRLPPESPHFNLWVGLFGMLLANAGAFVVSGQVYGDPFISCLLAMVIGIILSSTRLEGVAATGTAQPSIGPGQVYGGAAARDGSLRRMSEAQR